METDERAIRKLHSTWIDAVNAGDLACLLALMTDDAVFFGPGRAPLGRDGFSANFSAAQRQLQICCISELEEVVVVGEVAYTQSRDSLSVTPRSNREPDPNSRSEPTQHAGHRLTIYRKKPGGPWLLSRDAHTLS